MGAEGPSLSQSKEASKCQAYIKIGPFSDFKVTIHTEWPAEVDSDCAKSEKPVREL